MAKKKGGKTGKPSAREEAAGPGLEAENSASAVDAPDVPSAEPSVAEPSAAEAQAEPVSPPPASSDSAGAAASGGDDAVAELKAQIDELKACNAALLEENQRLKAAASSAVSVAPLLAPTVDAGQMEQLQMRIASLKAEQVLADATREAAWRQLKTVVADITRLAAPDAKASTPTAAGTTMFGAAA
ncbi:hypothetical protein TSOC_008324 [Tetrabaena socialis]|uniref:Uncharacterized protein n=1 Tax=Tetrabaena socialis TaxID=47790 RepID=A0A2J7ZYT3_9CHLO|nr:hypothetical protein TSOC_008324 [Tetrabaena socialis]|eukprot:PNH05422.1 hypothetical protein TSOC_008324 [Tetrabaena socialis]